MGPTLLCIVLKIALKKKSHPLGWLWFDWRVTSVDLTGFGLQTPERSGLELWFQFGFFGQFR